MKYLDRILSWINKDKIEDINIFKFSKGEQVRITIYNEIPEFWYIGEVLEIGDYEKGYYKVKFQNSSGNIIYWFHENELSKYNLQEERNYKIEEILKK